jgi:PleD family two-component response regulator
MTGILTASIAPFGVHPVVAAALFASGIGVTWWVHIWRLRRRERQLVALVAERTRQWQDEADAHAALRECVDAAALREAEGQPTEGDEDDDHTPRVLVVDDRRDRRDAISTMLATMGLEPAFADSQWAAAVASHQADADGTPYDLILIGKAMEGGEAGGVV